MCSSDLEPTNLRPHRVAVASQMRNHLRKGDIMADFRFIHASDLHLGPYPSSDGQVARPGHAGCADGQGCTRRSPDSEMGRSGKPDRP